MKERIHPGDITITNFYAKVFHVEFYKTNPDTLVIWNFYTLQFRYLFQLKYNKQNSDPTCTKDEFDLLIIC